MIPFLAGVARDDGSSNDHGPVLEACEESEEERELVSLEQVPIGREQVGEVAGAMRGRWTAGARET